jgi:hypothetical protein
MNLKWLNKWNALPLAFVLAGAAGSLPVYAQSQSGQSQPSSNSNPDTIKDRKENQQDRIAQGVKSGQLTAGETANLENKEANINQETRDDRAANGGKLTTGEKQQINRQQNRMSNQIYQDKHNANTAHYGNNEVGQRRENQQDRIANGIQSGKMNARQAANVENKESAINHEDAADRKANGGKLTSGEKAKINRQQNQTSRQIYRDKHGK